MKSFWGRTFAPRMVIATGALALSACAVSSPESPGGASSQRAAVAAPLSAHDFAPDESLRVCSGIRVSNAPRVDRHGYVKGYKPYVRVEHGAIIAVSPVKDACITSGFGWRGRKLHKGADLQSPHANMVHAGGSGVIREAGYHRDYGNYVLIDHGGGVFTRYAHLAGFERGVRVGAHAPLGAPLGMMGSTGGSTRAIHLHYELLIGDYHTAKRSFGLLARNVFDYPYVN